MTVPGIGPIISSAMVAAIGTGDVFSKGRDFAAWLGLVPRQISTGDRTIHTLKGRLGPKKAAVAVAANLLRVVYHMLKDGTCYKDLGEGYQRPRNPARAAANLAKRISALGYQVDIRRAA